MLDRLTRFFRSVTSTRPAMHAVEPPSEDTAPVRPPKIVPLLEETTARFARETVTVWIGDARFEAYRV